MGERGPQPKPTPLKVLQGTRKSRINANEPKPAAPRTPSAPATLSPVARKVWKRLANDLWRKGVLTEWDVDEFAVYCEAVATHRKATTEMQDQELIVDSDRGARIRNPLLIVIKDQAEIILKYSRQFGLTPSARSGLELPERATPEKTKQLLSG